MSRVRRPTITDVAALAGVSVKSVSRVINDVPTVAPEIRAAVLDAVSTLGYHSNRGAASLRSGRSRIAAFIVRDISNPFYSGLIAGATEVAEQAGLQLLTASSDISLERQSALVDTLMEYRPQALLVTPTGGRDRALEREHSFGTTIVAVDQAIEGLECDVVGFDNRRDCARAMSVALDLGWGQPAAIIDSDSLRTMPQRLEGVQQALIERGFDPIPTRRVLRAHSFDDALNSALQLFSLPSPPASVFCGNNVIAYAALQAAHIHQMEINIIVFDPVAGSPSLDVRIISIEHDARDIGRLAMRVALERAEEPQAPFRQHEARTWLTLNPAASRPITSPTSRQESAPGTD